MGNTKKDKADENGLKKNETKREKRDSLMMMPIQK
jgi:hypothetical protein